MVRAYSVTEPFFFAEADPEVDYLSAIQRFAEKQFAHLARKVEFRMQRSKPSGVFSGESKRLKNMWAEWCWYYEKHAFYGGPLYFAFEDYLSTIIDDVVQSVDDEVAILLCCAAAEEQNGLPWRSNDLIASTIREMLSEAAGARGVDDYEDY